METKPENLSPQESLDIITRMIAQAKGNMQRNHFFFLFWGWVVLVGYVGMFILKQLVYPFPYIIWLITVPAWAYTFYQGFKMGRAERAVTHLDKVNRYLWISFGTIVFTFVAIGYQLNYQLTPVILILTSMPTFVSGIILRFKPLLLGGIIFWVSGIAASLCSLEFQPLVGAFAIFCGYLVPGYILKNKKE